MQHIEVVEQLIHTSVQTDVGTEVLKQTEQPLVLLVTLLTLPDAGDTEHGATLREEIEHQQVASLHAVHHGLARILGPTLNHPYSLRIHTFHGLHHGLTGFSIIDIWIVVTLMEGIHRIVIGLTKQLGELIII